MRFGRDVPLLIIGAIGLALALLAAYATQLYGQQSRAVEKATFAQLRAILEFNLSGAEDRALARAEMVATMPAVQDAFAARDRERLLAETAGMYRVQSDKYGVAQAQFHLPPATSFLRLNAPAKHGEDLSGFRPIVVATNAERAARKGLSVGRSGPAVFGVVPVFDRSGAHIGSFEMGMEFGPVLDRLKAAYGIESALFFDEETLRTVATSMPGDALDEHRRVGSFLRQHSTNWERMRPLVAGKDLARVNGSDVEYRRSHGGVAHAVVLMALRRPDGSTIGIIAAAQDLSATHGGSGRTAVALAAAALGALVLLAGVVIVTIRGLLLRPLARVGAELDALAGGPPAPPDDTPAVCREIADFQASVARLRERPTPPEAP